MGLDLPEGKVKYQDERVINLDKKFEAKKVTPFYAEFIKDDGQQCDGFIISPGPRVGPAHRRHGKAGDPGATGPPMTLNSSS